MEGKRFDDSGSELPPLPRKRPTPQEAWGMRIRKKADVGWVYTSVFRDAENSPVEVFINIGKTGGYVAGAAEVTGRLASRALKYGASLEEIASDLVGISCGTPYGIGPDSVLSAFDAVGKSLIEISNAKQLQLPIREEITTEGLVKKEPTVQMAGQSNGQANGYTNGQSNGQANGNGQNLQMTITQGAEMQLDTGLVSGIHEEKIIENKFIVCPDCSSPVVYQEGCRKCVNPTCGWSKCS